jgi:hypothetical protein
MSDGNATKHLSKVYDLIEENTSLLLTHWFNQKPSAPITDVNKLINFVTNVPDHTRISDTISVIDLGYNIAKEYRKSIRVIKECGQRVPPDYGFCLSVKAPYDTRQHISDNLNNLFIQAIKKYHLKDVFVFNYIAFDNSLNIIYLNTCEKYTETEALFEKVHAVLNAIGYKKSTSVAERVFLLPKINNINVDALLQDSTIESASKGTDIKDLVMDALSFRPVSVNAPPTLCVEFSLMNMLEASMAQILQYSPKRPRFIAKVT